MIEQFELPPHGSAYFSVNTPSFFREHLLPVNAERDTRAERKKRNALESAAERHGTYVRRSQYRLG